MKNNIASAFRLTLALLVLCCGAYPALVWGAAQVAPGQGQGVQVSHKGRVVGFEDVGQKFDRPEYFSSRPSAVDYRADGSGGSNKGPTNPEYVAEVGTRVAAFLRLNPSVKPGQVPVEMVTASGSGLDPHISPAGAYAQVERVARLRGLPAARVKALVDAHVQEPIFVLLGPVTVNVLQLNLALDTLTEK
ncbi:MULTISPECIES: potassium-transporting ATPase subunit KdpC [Hymenobacter]|uniref:Potassium-transporting ATPase KdpC subunit n=2 Tax=Hymenobacter TaxID=89966 RepID=A0A7Y7PQN8_9BACT|nr:MULTISPECIES: potassium-transporting ATPase subunit KdpC [Hymenobacter]NVO32074.1 potassium-transporting ATPase subunit KdpC [Hymenobacter lapidiphilus]NVO86439.1 potassium-transporting ATPase subunit KdpC [Hymenobacter terrestris]